MLKLLLLRRLRLAGCLRVDDVRWYPPSEPACCCCGAPGPVGWPHAASAPVFVDVWMSVGRRQSGRRACCVGVQQRERAAACRVAVERWGDDAMMLLSTARPIGANPAGNAAPTPPETGPKPQSREAALDRARGRCRPAPMRSGRRAHLTTVESSSPSLLPPPLDTRARIRRRARRRRRGGSTPAEWVAGMEGGWRGAPWAGACGHDITRWTPYRPCLSPAARERGGRPVVGIVMIERARAEEGQAAAAG